MTRGLTPPARPTLLILGGSQGAAGVNRLATRVLPGLRDRLEGWRIVHQSGDRDEAAVRAAYAAERLPATVAAFFPDLPRLYGDAALCVTRAGATTLAELACAAVPAVLVPYPGAVRDHQRRNAERFAAAGAALVVDEGTGDEARFDAALRSLLGDVYRRFAMAEAMAKLACPDAAATVADLLAGATVRRLAA